MLTLTYLKCLFLWQRCLISFRLHTQILKSAGRTSQKRLPHQTALLQTQLKVIPSLTVARFAGFVLGVKPSEGEAVFRLRDVGGNTLALALGVVGIIPSIVVLVLNSLHLEEVYQR